MKLKINNWNICLQNGIKGEELVDQLSSDFYPLFCQPQILHVLFQDNSMLQKQGIDLIVSFPKIKVEVKTREPEVYKHKDILLEICSIIETQKPGWIYTSKADIIIYLWFNDSHTKFLDGYFLFRSKILAWILETDQKELPEYIKIITANSEDKERHLKWQTGSIAVPISKMLEFKLMEPIKKDYNAILKKWFVS